MIPGTSRSAARRTAPFDYPASQWRGRERRECVLCAREALARRRIRPLGRLVGAPAVEPRAVYGRNVPAIDRAPSNPLAYSPVRCVHREDGGVAPCPRRDLLMIRAEPGRRSARWKRFTSPSTAATTFSRWRSSAGPRRGLRVLVLRAPCHPSRLLFRDRLCRRCYQEQPRELATDLLPVHIIGAAQRAGPVLPLRCPKCHVGPPAWHVDVIYARCWLCGVDAYLTGRTMCAQAAGALAAAQTNGERWMGRLVSAT